jgi:hypothetical protein
MLITYYIVGRVRYMLPDSKYCSVTIYKLKILSLVNDRVDNSRKVLFMLLLNVPLIGNLFGCHFGGMLQLILFKCLAKIHWFPHTSLLYVMV